MNNTINKNLNFILYGLTAIIYILGVFIPLIENDSAQHATMGMRIAQYNDFTHLFRGPVDPYLDKPHLHFWLAALSFKLFGINQFAYRIPALLFTGLAAYSTFKFTKDLYGNKLYAHFAAIIFLTSETIILANHDVRTDAVFTGAVILAIWQLYRYIATQKLLPLVIGAFALGLAFSTKGLLGVVVTGACLFCHIAYTRSWKVLLNPKLFIGLVVFTVTICPVLYAYYVQFDMHPEVEVNGFKNLSGVKFILWDQSFNRMTATGFKTPKTPDHLFFFHTVLWVFFPWSLFFYTGVVYKIKELIKNKFRYVTGNEVLTWGGTLLVLIVISFSKSKLPHYLNSLMPVMSVFTAGFLLSLYKNHKEKTAKAFLYVVYFMFGAVVLVITGILFFTFSFPSWFLIIAIVAILALLFMYLRTNTYTIQKVIVGAALVSIVGNLAMSGYFYPHLLHYQSGKWIAEYIQEHLPNEKIYIYDKEYRWSLDFYNKKLTPTLTQEELTAIKAPILLTTNELDTLKEALQGKPYKIEEIETFDDYRITKLSLKFLNKHKRKDQVKNTYLLRIIPE